MSGKRIFVTGGAGFIGSRLVNALSSNAAEICVYDSLLPQVHGEGAICPHFPPNVYFVRGDVRDEVLFERVLGETRPDIVYHLAAETGTGQSRDEVTRYCDVNVGGTARLIEAVRRLVNPPAYVLLAGTRAVYGEGAYKDMRGNLFVPPPRTAEEMKAGKFEPHDSNGHPLRPLPTSESSTTAPASVYATTKLTQEYLLIQGFEDTPVKTVVLRFQNVYGPGQSLRNPYTGVLSIFLSQILARQRLNIYEDGAITRDFVFVQDVVRSLELAGEMQLPRGTIINIGSGQGVTILEAAKKLLEILGRETDNLDITGEFRPGDVRHAVADISLAGQLLGWRPNIPLDEGLRQLAHSTLHALESGRREAELSYVSHAKKRDANPNS